MWYSIFTFSIDHYINNPEDINGKIHSSNSDYEILLDQVLSLLPEEEKRDAQNYIRATSAYYSKTLDKTIHLIDQSDMSMAFPELIEAYSN